MTPYQVEKRLIEAKVQDKSVTYGVGELIVDLEKVAVPEELQERRHVR